MINGVVIRDLKVVPDERGRLGEILRSDWEGGEMDASQVYFTTNYPGVIKAWHFHRNQDDRVACVSGMIKLVMFDGREDSETKGEIQEVFLGIHSPKLVRIPAGVYHGWKCISENESVVINIPTNLYNYENPDEERLPFDTDKIDYDWNVKHG